jgi:N-acetylmuramic acid 6-phosphate etherase
VTLPPKTFETFSSVMSAMPSAGAAGMKTIGPLLRKSKTNRSNGERIGIDHTPETDVDCGLVPNADQPSQQPSELDELVTEGRPSPPAEYEALATLELVKLINHEDAGVPAAVAAVGASLATLIDAVVAKLSRGGRLIYVGAGTSGAIAALDAAECESTFGADPDQVLALVAGAGLVSASERDAAEDDAEAGIATLRSAGAGAGDAVIGVSASGRTPYVVGALGAAAGAGALTACVVSVPESELAAICEHELAVVVGPEFVAGSTRLKAGTAQKLVLNTISTVAMIRLGKTYGDLMVEVAGTNEKLQARARRAVELATGASPSVVEGALAAADGRAKVAIVSILAGVDARAAEGRLEDAAGSVREALR